MDWLLAIQLALLSATAFLAVSAALSARRAASFDLTRDFDALAQSVAKLQGVLRSTTMQRVRAAALEPKVEASPGGNGAAAPPTHAQLRELARARGMLR